MIKKKWLLYSIMFFQSSYCSIVLVLNEIEKTPLIILDKHIKLRNSTKTKNFLRSTAIVGAAYLFTNTILSFLEEEPLIKISHKNKISLVVGSFFGFISFMNYESFISPGNVFKEKCRYLSFRDRELLDLIDKEALFVEFDKIKKYSWYPRIAVVNSIQFLEYDLSYLICYINNNFKKLINEIEEIKVLQWLEDFKNLHNKLKKTLVALRKDEIYIHQLKEQQKDLEERARLFALNNTYGIVTNIRGNNNRVLVFY